TSIPIATGERLFTKWGFRQGLEKQAAAIVQPDLCHAGGILEGKKIAAMAECYYAAVAPHNPLGPISLAACLQLDACIPNFLVQEQVNLGHGYLQEPFRLVDGYIELPTGPGLGIELDDEAVKAKIGPPTQPELAIGAVISGDHVRLLDEQAIRYLGVSDDYIERETARQFEEIRRRLEYYRGARPPVDVHGKTVFIIDDGIATGY